MLQLSLFSDLELQELMQSAPDFPANLTPKQERGEHLWTKGTCGLSFTGLFAMFNHDGLCLKMSSGYLVAMLDGSFEEFSGTWPKHGLMLSGRLFQQPRWEPCTDGKGYSLLPTPTASDATVAAVFNDNTQIYYTRNGTPRKVSNQGIDGSVGLNRFVQLLPTPKATDGYHPGVKAHKKGQTLHLSAALAKMSLPTPTARDWKYGSAAQVSKARSENLNDRAAAITGKPLLNPNFVEALMGYPPGWTEL